MEAQRLAIIAAIAVVVVVVIALVAYNSGPSNLETISKNYEDRAYECLEDTTRDYRECQQIIAEWERYLDSELEKTLND